VAEDFFIGEVFGLYSSPPCLFLNSNIMRNFIVKVIFGFLLMISMVSIMLLVGTGCIWLWTHYSELLTDIVKGIGCIIIGIIFCYWAGNKWLDDSPKLRKFLKIKNPTDEKPD
jgi:hypothetical protein